MSEEPNVSQEAHGNYIAQAAHGGHATVNVHVSPPSLDHQNRTRFLVRLRTRYREGPSQSLHGVVRMTLELASHPAAVAPPVPLLYESDKQPTRSLEVSTSLFQEYTKAGHELLLLGEPGIGKSTLLLELALELVMQAEQDQSLPLPVIIPLSSWANKRLPLEQWMASQVTLLYDLPQRLATRWVQEERLLPLLDGLDEMEEGARAAYIAAINVYHREHLHPLVVVSRKAAYEAASTHERLTLSHAIVVQPLSTQQVDAYLEQCGEPVAALRTALRENPTLQEIATTPLMLSILLLTYQGQVVGDLSVSGSFSEQQQQIFTAYIQRMCQKKLAHSPSQHLIRWLSWLARQMRERNQTIFFLEHLQPDWLIVEQRQTYTWLAIRLPAILIGTLASLFVILFLDPSNIGSLLQVSVLGGWLGGLFSITRTEKASFSTEQGRIKLRLNSQTVKLLASSVVIGLLISLSFGITSEGNSIGGKLLVISLVGLIFSVTSLVLIQLLPLLDIGLSHQRGKTTQRWQWFLHWISRWGGERALLVTIMLGGSLGLRNWLSSGQIPDRISWLSEGLQYGLISVLISLVLGSMPENVSLTEQLQWTWQGLLRSLRAVTHLRGTFFFICLMIFMIGLNDGLNSELFLSPSGWVGFGLLDGLSVGLSAGLSYWLLFGLFQGIVSKTIDNQKRQVPNQGIHRSGHNSLLMGLISISLIALSSILSYILRYGLSDGLDYGLNAGMESGLDYGLNDWLRYGLLLCVCGSLLVCVISGALAVLRHYIIRFLLARSHSFSWDAPRFLEEATARILLRRVGGGYSFPHRLLLDYFANLPEEMP